MKRQRWNYEGDVSLEHGGFYWREMGLADCVDAVRVTPASDGDGPDNVFEITSASISLSPGRDGEHLKGALSCCGIESANPSRAELVSAFFHYRGLETESVFVVRIGPPDPFWRGNGEAWNPSPDRVLRSDADLANFVRREFLR